MSTLYDNINLLCKSEGITGYRLCKDLGISPSVITDLKKGRKKGLSADYAEKIAAYFDVSVSYLLRDTSKIGKPIQYSGMEKVLREHFGIEKGKPAAKNDGLSGKAEISDVEHQIHRLERKKESPPSEEGGRYAEYVKALSRLCSGDLEKLQQVQDALAKDPEKTIASFDLFLKTL